MSRIAVPMEGGMVSARSADIAVIWISLIGIILVFAGERWFLNIRGWELQVEDG